MLVEIQGKIFRLDFPRYLLVPPATYFIGTGQCSDPPNVRLIDFMALLFIDCRNLTSVRCSVLKFEISQFSIPSRACEDTDSNSALFTWSGLKSIISISLNEHKRE